MKGMNFDGVLMALRGILDDDAVRTEADIGERHMTDWSQHNPTRPAALLLPRTVQQVADALAVCNHAHQTVVPQGGMTGLSGGAVPRSNDIVLSLDRMVGIEEIDPASATMTVLAGTTLQAAQDAAIEAGFELGLDFGARGSCQIGGNLATNAGGNRVIQSGTAREQVLGLEVVLPSGAILTSMNKMVKNNTGYDLKHLFIGSEGTLGIITRAVLRLLPRRTKRHLALVAFAAYDKAVELLRSLTARFGADVSAFELMWPSFFEFGVSLTASGCSPFDQQYPLYALVELAGFETDDDGELFGDALGKALDMTVIQDAVIAQSLDHAQRLWAIRECTAEFPVKLDPINFDVSIPIGTLGNFVDRCRVELDRKWPRNVSYFFGHIGDSNLHLTVDGRSVPHASHHSIYSFVYEMLRGFDGSISAEHGVGSLKQEFLHISRSAVEIATMSAIKSALDPNWIMNPGKVIRTH